MHIISSVAESVPPSHDELCSMELFSEFITFKTKIPRSA